MNATSRTAYILQIHKNPNQVNKFINQLISDGQSDVYVHIDKRNYEDIHENIIKHPQVKILQNSIVCKWSDISMVATTILLLREVLAAKQNYDFVCLRSGQDLLVKDCFKEFLEENNDKIFMQLRNIDKQGLIGVKVNWPEVTRRKYTTPHPFRIYSRIIYELYKKGINLFPNTNYWPRDYSFYTGSQWFTIPLEVARYIIKFIDENEWYYKFFEQTLAPDEWFFHTLIMNSHYKSYVVNNNLFYLVWGKKFSEKGSPVILTSKDVDQIQESDCFFARKFDQDIDDSVIDYFANKVKFGRVKDSRQKHHLIKTR